MAVDDWDYYYEYVNYLYDRDDPGRIYYDEKIVRKSNKFLGEDVIRFYNNYLTLADKQRVKDYFLDMFGRLVYDLQNSKLYQDTPPEGYKEPEWAVRASLHITLTDLIVETYNFIYEVLRAVQGIWAGAIVELITHTNYYKIVDLYERGVKLVNNWHTYYSYSFYKDEPLTDILSIPWWSW